MPLRKKMSRAFVKLLCSIGLDPRVQTPSDADADFLLNYKGTAIGQLRAEGGRWTFRYTDDFRQHGKISPLVIFPEKEKVYESSELWPFFKMRVPSLKQPSIRAIIDREHIDERDQVKLLRRFGRRTISNPFELVAIDGNVGQAQ